MFALFVSLTSTPPSNFSTRVVFVGDWSNLEWGCGMNVNLMLGQYVNCELPDVQGGFRKGRGTGDQIANIRWIMEKAREFQKNIYFCFIDYAKPLTVWITRNCGKF